MMLSNWDNKDVRDVKRGSNTAIFQTPSEGGLEDRYLITDWGGSMGNGEDSSAARNGIATDSAARPRISSKALEATRSNSAIRGNIPKASKEAFA